MRRFAFRSSGPNVSEPYFKVPRLTGFTLWGFTLRTILTSSVGKQTDVKLHKPFK